MDQQPHIDELTTLNLNIADWEQWRDAGSIAKLDAVLSPALMFRRADGSVVDKDAFMLALQKPSPFSRRASKDVAVALAGERALVTLVVEGMKPDGSIGRYRNLRLFFRRAAKWQLEFWFNDDVTNAGPGQ